MHRAAKVAVRVISDLVALLAVIIAMFVLQRVKPVRLGYFTNDESLQYPFHHSTIPYYLVCAVTLILMALLIISVELLRHRHNLKQRKYEIPVVLYSIYDHTIIASYGYGVTIVITNVAKAFTGRLRPNFLSLCKPIPDVITTLGYISDFTCTTGSERDKYEISKSFISGHSSTAMFATVYLAVYLQFYSPREIASAIRVLLQSIIVAFGLAVCCSRIMDNKHHWTDVIAGLLCGVLVALSTCFYMPWLLPSKEDTPTLLKSELNSKEMPLDLRSTNSETEPYNYP